MFKYIILTLFLHKFIILEATPVPNDDEPENLRELKEETNVAEDDKTEDEGWLARIVPEIPNIELSRIVQDIQLSDYLKPWTVQIPILSFPEMPSYSISLAKK